MGSIQAMRSDALANRSKADTNLEISAHIGNVNKSLGSQIVKMIDDLQGVIGQRTKAYNGLVGQINQAINGKGGIGDQGVKWAFQVVNVLIAAVGVINNPTGVSDIISMVTDVLTSVLQQQSIRQNLLSSYHDYEKMVSQLGFSSVDAAADTNGSDPGGAGYTHSGAAGLVRIRDSVMNRYKPLDPAYPNLNYPTFNYQNRGYVGTLRRL